VAPGRGIRVRVALVVALAMMVIAVAGTAGYLVLGRGTDNPGCSSPQRSAGCVRILFLGNSYTGVNDLPDMFADLAWSGRHRVETGVQAPGGWTLEDHARSAGTVPLLSSRPWDLVVLQEQSQVPSLEESRQAVMYPAARQLVGEIRAAGARPLLYVSWAREGGWPENGLPDYASMQAAIDAGYLGLAAEEHAAQAPVGFAWTALASIRPASDLWQADGSHPTQLGTYLAACVFYAAVFDQAPYGLDYRAGLAPDDAAAAQRVATATVLGAETRWGLPPA